MGGGPLCLSSAVHTRKRYVTTKLAVTVESRVRWLRAVSSHPAHDDAAVESGTGFHLARGHFEAGAQVVTRLKKSSNMTRNIENMSVVVYSDD